jgi:hypothetical protein
VRRHPFLWLLLFFLWLLLAYTGGCRAFDLGCFVVDDISSREERAVLARLQPGWTPEQVAQEIGRPPDGGTYAGHPDSYETRDLWWSVGGRRIEVVYYGRRAHSGYVLRARSGPIREALFDFFNPIELD